MQAIRRLTMIRHTMFVIFLALIALLMKADCCDSGQRHRFVLRHSQRNRGFRHDQLVGQRTGGGRSMHDFSQFRSSISNTFPRLTPRFEQFVPAGRSGWFKLWEPGLFGISGALINFNANAMANAGAFNQGHNLHTLTNTSTASYVVPVFPPNC